jgi:PAS domain S-box-containing protein
MLCRQRGTCGSLVPGGIREKRGAAMNPIGVVDFIALLAILMALVILWSGWKRALESDAKLLLSGLFILVLFHYLSNTLEWGGISKTLDPFEDYVEILEPVLWFFFFYTFLKDVEIIEHRRLEEELRKSEESLHITLHSIGDAVIATDINSNITLMNPVAEKLTGWSFEEARRNPLTKIFHIVNALTKKPAANPVRRVIESGSIVGLANHTVLIDRDGNEYHIADSGAPIIDKNGNISGAVLVFRDVNEIYAKEQKLRENEQFLNSILESVQDGISVLDPEFTILHVNGVMNKWYAENVPLEGKKCFKCYHNRGRLCDPCPSLRCLESGKTEMNVVPGLPGSDVEWLELYSYPIRDSDSGETTGIIEFVRDITGRKKAEEELLNSRKLESVGILAGGIAHDFNNILTGVFGNIELAKLKIPREHAAYTHIEIANTALERATYLTKQLLTFAKGGDPILDSVDMRSVVQSTVSFNLSGSNVKVYFNLPDNLWQLKADRGQLSQVIANLTINAKQAMPDGGNLYIDAENIKGFYKTPAKHFPGNFVKLIIRDEGVGISPKYVERIFDPYFSTKQTGSGLGLATVHSIITKHNGYISVDSIPDAGTIFTMFLPAEKSSHKQTVITHSALIERPQSASGHILIMDDEEIIRNVLAAMLEACGYTVDFSSDGKDAVEKYISADKSGNSFDIAIIDLTVPGGIGGKETVKKFLAIDPEAKVIVSSGYSTDFVMANYKDYGFKGRLVKPFQMEDLKKELSRVMGME